ncbi:MAG TPA: hypothetical protein VE753_01965 [Gaiellaceae bacterium]|nr:hypothetical protein [Gaiellaceae bacterium]
MKFGGKWRPPGRLATSTTRRSPEPAGPITYTKPLSPFTNAISVPSGDQLGDAASSGPIALLCEPSAFIT